MEIKFEISFKINNKIKNYIRRLSYNVIITYFSCRAINKLIRMVFENKEIVVFHHHHHHYLSLRSLDDDFFRKIDFRRFLFIYYYYCFLPNARARARVCNTFFKIVCESKYFCFARIDRRRSFTVRLRFSAKLLPS